MHRRSTFYLYVFIFLSFSAEFFRMSHRQSTDTYEFRPSKRYIPPADNYKEGDYLTGVPHQTVPNVGATNTSPVRGKRHVTNINPYDERMKAQEEKQQRQEQHNKARGERLAQLEHRNEYANGFGGDGYVPSKKIVDDPVRHMDKETNARMKREARYYTDPSEAQARANSKQYSSNIGYVKFDYTTQNPVSYGGTSEAAREEMPSGAKGGARRTDAFTSSDLLKYDPDNAPRHVSPRKKLTMEYEAKHSNGSNIITNQGSSNEKTQSGGISPRKKATVEYERKYQRSADLISNQPHSSSETSQQSPAAPSARYAAREQYMAKNGTQGPFSHMQLLNNVPTAQSTGNQKQN